MKKLRFGAGAAQRGIPTPSTSSRTRATGGAGLGLAIVDSLVTAHAGRVEIHSTTGHGATFQVLLPHPTDPGTPCEPPADPAPRAHRTGKPIYLS
ncbi:ATP-binding protein [Streptomyces albicerus]|uniref:ATP-binding protein n=1 Tax=Streptomyces albicerus TaxID=2569859 RepID=UPI0038502B46